ncbi:hypothetical protein Bca4012_065932 [Brassica carinata]|uniref:Uncharacterized protein n=1 Tax=Brassica carinata TaxID=52824 RepID=A0A8X7VPK1_BRACI|nr:hypothetical protein Bca52824_018263 [Brassica carinata]
MPEITEPDIEKAEQSISREPNHNVFEKAHSSTEPKVTKQNIGEAESSTKPEVSGYDDEESAEILVKMNMLINIGAKSPKLQRKGEDSCCIFRIPKILKKIHPKGCEPGIVSIGPYHHQKKHLQLIEQHKHRYLKLFLDEANKEGVDMNVLGRKILGKEAAIRNSYSMKFVATQPELLKMMLLDGCFILVLLLKMVPFFVLKTLLEESKLSKSTSLFQLKKLAFDLGSEMSAEHLLDLIRKNFINGTSHRPKKISSSLQCYSRLILSAKRLRFQGIKFKASHDKEKQYCFSMRCWKIIIAILSNKTKWTRASHTAKVLDGLITSVLLNCVAFEQLSTKCTNNITNYVVFMGCLMNDDADATYLSEKGIIENYFGNGSYLKEEFEGINKYTSSRWNVECARFKHLYFDSPWSLLSSFAVLTVIFLSIAQTIFGGLSYLGHRK